MIEKCAEKMADFLIQSSVIEKEEKELYSYAVQSVLCSFAPLVFALILGIIMDCLKNSLYIIFSFMCIRKFSGGYHAKSPLSCFVFSGLLLSLCIRASIYITCSWLFWGAVLLAVLCLVFFSPIENENRTLEADEKRSYKKITVSLVIAFSGIMGIFYLVKQYEIVVSLGIGVILTAILQIPCVVRSLLKKSRSKNDQKNA